MGDESTHVCVITARGGSKRLPGKNVKDFLGYPLIAWSIWTARQSKCFDQIVVSTDCEEIARVAEEYGASIPFLRDSTLSGDSATSESAIIDVAKRLKLGDASTICLLQPTSPLRDCDDVKQALALYHTDGVDSVLSVCEFKLGRRWLLSLDENGFLRMPATSETSEGEGRVGEFFPNGSIYITTVKGLCTTGSLSSGNSLPWNMPAWKSIDIDLEDDFELAELAMKKFAPHRLVEMGTL